MTNAERIQKSNEALRATLELIKSLPTVDDELSPTSTNPVQNKVIYAALEDKLETEEDPTVPAWAKASTKPSYTASEVGARPNTWMPSAEDVGARPNTWTPSYSDVGADQAGEASRAVSTHNTNTEAHNDIRLELTRLAGIINDILDSEDPNLDEMHEIVAYIKSNASLIEAVTIAKVNVADIIDNLTTNVTSKPLSAAQGVALKALIDAITVPTKVSELENNVGYQTAAQVNTLINNALGVIENGTY